MENFNFSCFQVSYRYIQNDEGNDHGRRPN